MRKNGFSPSSIASRWTGWQWTYACHNVQPGTPLENVFAMVETVQQS